MLIMQMTVRVSAATTDLQVEEMMYGSGKKKFLFVRIF
jgi:hypothetical protein